MNLLNASRLLLVMVAGTLAQAAYAQITADARPKAHAIMPDSAPRHRRSHAWILISPSVVHGPGQSSTTCSNLGDTCYYEPSDLVTAYTIEQLDSYNLTQISDVLYKPVSYEKFSRCVDGIFSEMKNR